METPGHWAAPSRAPRVRCMDLWASLAPPELQARAPNTARAPSAPCRPLLHLLVASAVAPAPEADEGRSLPFWRLSGEERVGRGPCG